ncbi:MAG: GGDEF domain-containing protein [Boseongicola sp.]
MGSINLDTIEFRHGTLAALMPMYLILDDAGIIENAGPTLVRVGGQNIIGCCFFDIFKIRRPQGVNFLTDLKAASGGPVHLKTTGSKQTLFRAVCVGLSGDGRRLLLNLSFGIHVSEAVAQHNLTISDFAATDLTVELLYLLEAKSAAMEESRNLNKRLEVARITAENSSLTDVLTGLPNRRGFEKCLAQFVEGQVPIALIAIDLDYFKKVNDTYGHAAGDAVLVEAASRFRKLLRKEDVIARTGGDEFLAIVDDTGRSTDLAALGQRIIDVLVTPLQFEGHACKISASIGIAHQFDQGNCDIDVLLRCADEALYASKRGGRSRVELAVGAPTGLIALAGPN